MTVTRPGKSAGRSRQRPLHEFGDITTDMENMHVVVHLNTKVCDKRKISPMEIMEIGAQEDPRPPPLPRLRARYR